MKRILFFFLLPGFFINVIAQQSGRSDNELPFIKNATIIKTNPFAVLFSPTLITSEYRIMIERQISPKSSFQLGASYMGINLLLGFALLEMDVEDMTQSNKDFNGFRLQGAYKYYFRSGAPEGSYFGPYFSFIKLYMKDITLADHSLYFFNIDFVYGYQHISKSGFTYDICMGFGYKYNSLMSALTEEAETTSLSNPGDALVFVTTFPIKLVFNINFGYRF